MPLLHFHIWYFPHNRAETNAFSHNCMIGKKLCVNKFMDELRSISYLCIIVYCYLGYEMMLYQTFNPALWCILASTNHLHSTYIRTLRITFLWTLNTVHSRLIFDRFFSLWCILLQYFEYIFSWYNRILRGKKVTTAQFLWYEIRKKIQ